MLPASAFEGSLVAGQVVAQFVEQAGEAASRVDAFGLEPVVERVVEDPFHEPARVGFAGGVEPFDEPSDGVGVPPACRFRGQAHGGSAVFEPVEDPSGAYPGGDPLFRFGAGVLPAFVVGLTHRAVRLVRRGCGFDDVGGLVFPVAALPGPGRCLRRRQRGYLFRNICSYYRGVTGDTSGGVTGDTPGLAVIVQGCHFDTSVFWLVSAVFQGCHFDTPKTGAFCPVRRVDAFGPFGAFRPGLSSGFLGHVLEGHVHAAFPDDGPVRVGHVVAVLVPLGELLVAPADASRLLERLQGTFDAGFARVRLGHQGVHGGPCAASVGLAAVGQGDEHESGRGCGCGRLPERP